MGLAAPYFFVKLDDAFDRVVASGMDALRWPHVTLAENLCRRLADVDYHASQVRAVAYPPQHPFSNVQASTSLVACFGACKGVLDAVAITLAELYALRTSDKGSLRPLTWKEQDFTKGRFWTALQKTRPELYLRYAPFRRERNAHVRDMIEWRDLAIHRVAPIVMIPMGRHLHDPAPPSPLGVLRDQSTDLHSWFQDHSREKSQDIVHPLYFYDLWRPTLVDLSRVMCEDVAAAL